MQWMIPDEDKPGGSNPKNRSKYGRRRSLEHLLATIRQILDSYDYVSGDNPDHVYGDLFIFSYNWNFTWDADGNVDLGNNALAQVLLRPDKDLELERTLGKVLSDIAQVASAQGFNSIRNEGNVEWKYKNGGNLVVRFSLPSLNFSQDAPKYRRVEFLLYRERDDKGRVPSHYYHWAIEYTEPNLLRLGVDRTITIDHVTRVKKVSDSVWILSGRNNDEIVVKSEVKRVNFANRHKWLTWLARRIFKYLPEIEPLTDEELSNISGIKLIEEQVEDQAKSETLPQLAERELRLPEEKRELYCVKIQQVSMGENLKKRIQGICKLMQAGHLVVGDQKCQALLKLLSLPSTFRALGEIAVFDLLLTNQDRFGARFVELKNIDFTLSDTPIAIDNVDPNHKIVNKAAVDKSKLWEDASVLQTKDARIKYAANFLQLLNKAIADLIRHFYEDEYGQDLPQDLPQIVIAGEDLTGSFSEGMEASVRRLKDLGPKLRKLGRSEVDLNASTLCNDIADRIASLE